MLSLSDLRRHSTRRLLLRTYCWGLVPILCVGAYLGDGDLLGRSRCAVNSVVPGSRSTIADAASGLACCAVEVRAVRAATQPTLVYSRVESSGAPTTANGQDPTRLCVYGANFGSKRGPSVLAVGGVQTETYEKWDDPGAPYGPGHYAEVCGQISHLSPSGSVGVQLTTPLGSSNTLPLTVRGGHTASAIGLAGAFTVAHAR
jgi:hypothetical protein